MIDRPEISEELSQLVETDRVPHALLFLGNTGWGTLDVALQLAETLLCQNIQQGKKCNQCKACLKSSRQLHPDLHFAFPVIKKDNKKREDTTSKDFLADWRDMLETSRFFSAKEWAEKINAENKQLNINTTECNEIIKKLGLKSFEGANKVMIIYLAEYLGKEGNRLLKLIEEPPDDTFIFLIAENQKLILNTILSRCQLFPVPPYQDATIKDYLEANNVNESKHEEIIFLSQGNIRKAQNLLNDTSDFELSGQLLKWLRLSYLLDSKPGDVFNWVNDFAKLGKTAQNAFLDYFLNFLREYQLSLLTDLPLRLSVSEQESAQKMKKIIDLHKVEKLSQIINNLHYNLSRNANVKIELTHTSMEICNLLHNKHVSI